jgi:hypothetical protein
MTLYTHLPLPIKRDAYMNMSPSTMNGGTPCLPLPIKGDKCKEVGLSLERSEPKSLSNRAFFEPWF